MALVNSLVQMLLNSCVLKQNVEDGCFWIGDKPASYTVRSAYSVIASEDCFLEKSFFNRFWNNITPLRVVAFYWILLLDRILLMLICIKKGVMVPPINHGCPFCKSALEASFHIFFTCNFCYCIWMHLYNCIGLDLVLLSDPKAHFLQHLGLLKKTIPN